MEDCNYICNECKESIPVVRNRTDSLLAHILKHNHFVFAVQRSDKEAAKSVSCCYCGNVNALVMGYSSSLKSYVCLGCLANKWVFSCKQEWNSAIGSWYPLALSHFITNYMDSVSEAAKVKYSTPADYPLELNQYYIATIRTMNKSVSGSYTFFRSTTESCCICIRPSERDILRAGMCCTVSIPASRVDRADCVVLAVDQHSAYLFVRGRHSLAREGLCTLSLRCFCEDVSFPLNAGLLKSGAQISATLFANFAGAKGKNGSFNNCRLSTFGRVPLSEKERSELSFVVQHCGVGFQREEAGGAGGVRGVEHPQEQEPTGGVREHE
mgnify:CR=1 FL=1